MKTGDSVGKGVHSSPQVSVVVGVKGISAVSATRVGDQVVVVGGSVSCADAARVGDSVGRRYGLTKGGDGVDLTGDGVGPTVGAVDVAGVSASRIGVPVVVGGSESIAPAGVTVMVVGGRLSSSALVGERVGAAVIVVGGML